MQPQLAERSGLFLRKASQTKEKSMKKFLTSTAALALMMSAAPAMAECNIGQTTDYTQQDEAVQATARRDLRELRNSAMILNTYGKEDACQSVVTAIQEIRDNRGMKQVSDNTTGTAGTPATTSATVDYKQVMSNAKPVSELSGRLTTAKMLNSDVRGANGEVVGEIENVVLSDEGQPSHAIIAFGGFLGLGEDRVAIPFSQLKTQSQVTDNDDIVFFVSMTEQQLQNAPRVKADDDSWLSNDDWVSQNDEYYQNNTVEG
jgi:hypothetical protein